MPAGRTNGGRRGAAVGISLERFSRLLGGIHDAALDVSLWNPTLADLVATFGGGGCGALMVNTQQSCRALHVSIGRDHAAVVSYNAYYSRMDPFASAVEQAPAGSVLRGWDVVPPAGWRRSEFFNDWAKPNGIGDCVFASLARDDGTVAWLGIGSPFRPEPFGDADRMRLMHLMVPHLQQALHVQASLGRIEARQHGALEAFNRLVHGVVLFDRAGSVVFANRAAEQIAASGDGLAIGQAGIRAALADEDAELQGLIGRARGKGHGLRAGGTLSLTRPSARQPFVVHVLPTNAGEDELPMSGVLAVVVDPERDPPVLAAALRRLYGLTKAEATVACEVLRGEGLQSVADGMSVSLSTVRIHLQRVFEKTRTHRQAELTRLLLTIEAGLDHDDGAPS
jgi:DNA-binding CsgD family transcriptional regulator/PAS domain-containing protein